MEENVSNEILDTDWKKKIILHVEDEPLRLKIDKENFEKNDFAVVQAKNCTDAIRLYIEKSPDIVLVDIQLECSTDGGFQVIRQIREKDPLIPILMLTSSDEEALVVKGYDLGINDYIRKSASYKEIIARINYALQNNPAFSKDTRKLVITSETYLDVVDHTLYSCGQPVKLAINEFRLLHFMLPHKNELISRELIISRIWRSNFEGGFYLYKSACILRKQLSRDKNINLISKRHLGITLSVK